MTNLRVKQYDCGNKLISDGCINAMFWGFESVYGMYEGNRDYQIALRPQHKKVCKKRAGVT